MREGGKMLASVLETIRKTAKPGMAELEIARLADKELAALGGKPVFKGYNGFPDVICISVNDEIVHGIPGDYEFKVGDLVGFDFGVNYKGLVTDSAFSMIFGQGSTEAHQLLSATEQSLKAAIGVLHDGVRVGDIGEAVESSLSLYDYGIVRELVGHGVGQSMHEEPDIPNYGKAGTGPVLKEGMTIAIEPMVNLGTARVRMDPDGWTIRTADGKISAHFEHTVLITEDGAEILTTL